MLKFTPVTFIDRHFRLLVWLFGGGLLALLPVVVYFIINSPHDYLQDELVLIMYIHVPAAWLALGIYSTICLLCASFLIFRNLQCYTLARLLAPVGMCYTAIALVSGSIWGKPAWGAWWVWDARLTSMLLLLFIYVGYYSLSRGNTRTERGAVMSSYYAVASFIIVPIIKFSVDLWSTLHQPSSVLRLDGPSIHCAILSILLITLVFHVFFTCLVVVLSVRIELLTKKRRRGETH